MGFLTGNEDKISQVGTKTQGQNGLLNQILQMLSGQGGVGQNYGKANDYIGNLLSGDPQAYQNFAAPHMRQFEEQTVPQLAERFAGLGGGMGGGLSNSGFAQALGGAGAGLQSNLAGLYAQIQQQAAGHASNQFGNLANQGLGTQTLENIYQPGSTGALGGLLQGLGTGAGMGLGMLGGTGVGKGVSAFSKFFGG